MECAKQNAQGPPDLDEMYHSRFFSLKDQEIEQPAQLSSEWFAMRKGKLSGSKLSQFMFIKTEEELTTFYEEVFEGRKRPPFTEEQQKWVKWGRDHEDIALKAMLDNVPNMVALEAPMVQHTSCDWIAASPDGFYEMFDPERPTEVIERGCVEIKCPAKSMKCNTKPTYYYIPQTYWEMACSGRDKVIFCSWGPDNCRAWKMHWTEDVWGPLCDIVHDFRKRKSEDAVPFDQWKILQHRLRNACHTVCNESAIPLHPPEGWGPQL